MALAKFLVVRPLGTTSALEGGRPRAQAVEAHLAADASRVWSRYPGDDGTLSCEWTARDVPSTQAVLANTPELPREAPRAPKCGREPGGRRFVARTGVLVVAALLASAAAACGSGGESGPRSDGPSVTVTTATTSGPVACPRGGLVAVEAASGSVVWSHCAQGGVGIEVLGADDRIVLAAEHSDRGGPTTLSGLDPATGAERWTASVTPFNESYERDAFYADGNRLGGGVVVFSRPIRDGGELVGLDAATGAERWSVPSEGRFVTGHGDDVAVTATPGALFETPPDAPQPDLTVVAVDRRTGATRWTSDRGIRDVGAPWGPRVGGGILVVPQLQPHEADAPLRTWSWDTVGIELATGEERWRRSAGPMRLLAAGPEHAVGLVPVAEGDAVEPARWQLEGFDTERGTRRWQQEIADLEPVVAAASASPVVAVATGLGARSGPAVAPTASTSPAPAALTVYDVATGAVRFRVDGALRPAAVTPTLVVVTAPDAVVALDAATGATRWQLPFAQPFGVEAVTRDGRLYLSSSRGMLDPPPESTSAPVTSPSGASTAPATSPTSTPAAPQGTVVLASSTLADGVPVRITERTGGPGQLCVSVGEATSRQVCSSTTVVTVEAGSAVAQLMRSVPLSSKTGPGSSGGSATAWFLVLPAGHARPVVARRPDGTVWLSAESQTSDAVVVIEPAGSFGTSPPPALDFVAPDGSVVARLPGPR